MEGPTPSSGDLGTVCPWVLEMTPATEVPKDFLHLTVTLKIQMHQLQFLSPVRTDTSLVLSPTAGTAHRAGAHR